MTPNTTPRQNTPSRRRDTPAIPWRERPTVTVNYAAELIGCSVGQVYVEVGRGNLEMVKLAGRSLIRGASLAAFVDAATPYTPDGTAARGAAGRAAAAVRNRPQRQAA